MFKTKNWNNDSHDLQMRKKKFSVSSINVCVQISDKDIQFSFPKRNFFMSITLSKVIPGSVNMH